MLRRAALVVSCCLGLVAGGCSREPDPLADGGGVDGPVLVAATPPDPSSIDDAAITGTLSLDHGCLFLLDDTLLHPTLILWPQGTRWRDDPAAVVLRNGDAIALGRGIDGGGGYYAPAELGRFAANPEVVEAAANCASDPTTGVAVLQGPLPAVTG